jgi:type I restriction enzyme S subunit
MTANDFFDQFAALADAPGGIPELRQLILAFAVQGKLVQQQATDEPAESLLKQIENRRQKLIREGKARDSKIEPVSESEKRHRLANGWTWVRLSSLGEFCGGSTPSMNKSAFWDGEIPWVSPKDMRVTHVSSSEMRITKQALDETTIRLLPPGSILIVARSGILKRTIPVAINDVECTVNQDLKAIVPFCNGMSEYIKLLIKGHERQILTELVKTGTTVQSLKYEEFERYAIPLPPLAEQKRIVAKVDRLMALCNALETQHQARHAVRSRLHATLLGNLQTAANAADFARSWQRLRDHFAELFTPGEAALDAVAQLRQTILRLAVQGKLVPQDAKDEPAETSLKRARKKRQLAAAEGFPNGQGNKPFDVPASWLWMTIGDVAESRLGKMLDQNKNKGTPYPYLRNTNVHWLRFDLSSIKEMPFEDDELDEYEVKTGDVLICEGGHGIARTAVWRGKMQRVMFQKALHRVQPFECIDSDFLSYCIKVYADSGFLEHYYTGAGIPHFTGRSLAKVIFPLPPVTEQQRIVAKVQQLMALCDALEASLKEAATVSERWSAAAVRQLA